MTQSWQCLSNQCQQFQFNYSFMYVSLSCSNYFRSFSCPIGYATLCMGLIQMLDNTNQLLTKPSVFYYLLIVSCNLVSIKLLLLLYYYFTTPVEVNESFFTTSVEVNNPTFVELNLQFLT